MEGANRALGTDGNGICLIYYRDFSRFSEDRPTHTEYGFGAVTSVVCVSGQKPENRQISLFCGSRWRPCDPFRTFIRARELSEGPIERLGPS